MKTSESNYHIHLILVALAVLAFIPSCVKQLFPPKAKIVKTESDPNVWIANLDLTGVWYDDDGNECYIIQEGNKVRWEASPPIEGRRIVTYTFRGQLKGDTLSGTFHGEGYGRYEGTGRVVFKVVKPDQFVLKSPVDTFTAKKFKRSHYLHHHIPDNDHPPVRPRPPIRPDQPLPPYYRPRESSRPLSRPPEGWLEQLDMSGNWMSNDRALITISQTGHQITWKAISSYDGGKTFTHTFNGALSGDTINGTFQDHAPGKNRNSGSLVFQVTHPDMFILKSSSGSFGASRIRRSTQ